MWLLFKIFILEDKCLLELAFNHAFMLPGDR